MSHQGGDAKEPDLTGYRYGRWIVNEGLLRDEGTVCGLTVDPEGIERKIKAIEAYYEVAAVRADRAQGPLSSRASAAREAREEAQHELQSARARLRELITIAETAASIRNHGPSMRQTLVRQASSLLLAVTAAGCGYVLVYEALADDFAFPAPIALAVLLGGTFTLFRPVSRLFGRDAEDGDDGVRYTEGWLQKVIEVVPPFIAAAFTCTWLVGERAIFQIVLTGIFLFVLFLFSGKLALSALTVVTRAVERQRSQHRERQTAERAAAEQRQRVAAAEARLHAAWDVEREVLEQLSALGDRREVEAIREYKKALFLSEVAFAKRARQEYDLFDVTVSGDRDDDED